MMVMITSLILDLLNVTSQFSPYCAARSGSEENSAARGSGHVDFERCTHKLWHSRYSTTMAGHNDINQWYMHMLESVLENEETKFCRSLRFRIEPKPDLVIENMRKKA